MNITRLAEVRAENRRLSGTVVRYGDFSPSHRERFEPGSIAIADRVVMNLEHRKMEAVAWYPGGGLTLDDNGERLELRAELPPIPAGDLALESVRAGSMTGLSVEFYADRERRDSGVRVIEAARMVGVGLVRNPSYQGSRVENRAARLRAKIPYRKPLPCKCSRKAEIVRIEHIDLIEGHDVLSIAGNYNKGFGSVKRGSLLLNQADDGLAIELSEAAMDSPAGRDLVAQAAVVPIIARPVFDEDLSESRVEGDVQVYDKMALKAVLFGPSDNSEGWPEVDFTGGQDRQHNREENQRVARPRWL